MIAFQQPAGCGVPLDFMMTHFLQTTADTSLSVQMFVYCSQLESPIFQEFS